MELFFGIAVLLLLSLGLYNRFKNKKTWVTEERHEESGAWIDKRAGERGAYGSLDDEMERERAYVSRRGKELELARIICDYAFEHTPGFHEKSDEEIKAISSRAKIQAEKIIALAEQVQKGEAPEMPKILGDAGSGKLKKIILDFVYDQFPQVLDREIELIRQLDAWVEAYAREME
jgi:hypothetical protein